MLPKFLLGDNSQDYPEDVFVVHTQTPRCIIKSDLEDFYTDQKIFWIDNEITDKTELNDFLAQAEQFLIDELNNQEDIYYDE